MSQAHSLLPPSVEFQDALRKLDEVTEYLRRKMEKRMARLSENPPIEWADERGTLPSMHLMPEGTLGSEEITPRLRRRVPLRSRGAAETASASRTLVSRRTATRGVRVADRSETSAGLDAVFGLALGTLQRFEVVAKGLAGRRSSVDSDDRGGV